MSSALLRSSDQAFLDDGFNCHVSVEGGMVCVVVEQFPLAAGLIPAASDLLIRLPPGFPDAYPDMFWFAERIRRADGGQIPATDLIETHVGRAWYRWSRHVSSQWRPGIDDLRSYFGYIGACLRQAAA